MSRVSSDEQAAGYSLGVQEEALNKYCERNEIEIVYRFKEDYSAKNFNRPAFTQFLKFVKENRGKVDCLLFTSWDRFSRNLLDSLEMINRLDSLGIKPIAIEQPLDLRIPENKAMLAMFLVLPEIDNDRRSIKIRGGVRAAMKAGRWARMAPMGYSNARDENNKPIIIQNGQAPIVKKIFEDVSKGIPQSFIRECLKKEGINIARSGLSDLLRNSMYAGLIVVPPFEGEPEQVVKAAYQPIISESLFNKVQDVLNGANRTRNMPNGKNIRPELPLRGHLLCSKCGNNMTGSASKSASGNRHFYYHCNYCSKERFKADAINNAVVEVLNAVTCKNNIDELFKAIVKEKIASEPKKLKMSPDIIKKKIAELDARLNNLQDCMLDKVISIEEYREMVKRYTAERQILEEQMTPEKKEDLILKKKLNDCLNSLKNLGNLYQQADVARKKVIISSIFPGKLIFDGKKCRTEKLNEVISLIINTGADFRQKKPDRRTKITSCPVWWRITESNR